MVLSRGEHWGVGVEETRKKTPVESVLIGHILLLSKGPVHRCPVTTMSHDWPINDPHFFWRHQKSITDYRSYMKSAHPFCHQKCLLPKTFASHLFCKKNNSWTGLWYVWMSRVDEPWLLLGHYCYISKYLPSPNLHQKPGCFPQLWRDVQ